MRGRAGHMRHANFSDVVKGRERMARPRFANGDWRKIRESLLPVGSNLQRPARVVRLVRTVARDRSRRFLPRVEVGESGVEEAGLKSGSKQMDALRIISSYGLCTDTEVRRVPRFTENTEGVGAGPATTEAASLLSRLCWSAADDLLKSSSLLFDEGLFSTLYWMGVGARGTVGAVVHCAGTHMARARLCVGRSEHLPQHWRESIGTTAGALQP